MSKIEIYTDGACPRNGKAGARAGYGVHFPDGEHRDICGPVPLPHTNQRAELYAVYQALLTVADEKYSQITIYTDSTYTLKALTIWAKKWVTNGWTGSKNKPVMNQDLLKPLYELFTEMSVHLIYVKAHTGRRDPQSIGNAEADRLAVQGAESLKV